MKVRLDVGPERYDALAAELERRGIKIDSGAELVLSEAGGNGPKLLVRDTETRERVLLSPEQVVLIESRGHTVEVHTRDRSYLASEALYKLLGQLDGDKFLRISSSAVIARDKVERISPTLSMKFILTLEGGRRVDVTRSYYYIFKEAFGI